MKMALLSATLVVISLPSGLLKSAELDNRTLGKEAIERQLAHVSAPIKTETDLRDYLATSTEGSTRFDALSPGARQRFVQSLVFTEKGLASFDYRDIQSELTASEIYQLLSLFGAQRSTGVIPSPRVETPTDAAIMDLVIELPPFADYPDYECKSRATCSGRVGSICIGANC